MRVGRWEEWTEPFFEWALEGCHVTRDIPTLIEEGGFRVERIETAYLARFPKSGSYYFWGVASNNCASRSLRLIQERREPSGAPRSEIPRRFVTVLTGCGGPSTRLELQRKPKGDSEQTNQLESPNSQSSVLQFRPCILVVSTPPGPPVVAAEQSAMPRYSRERSRRCGIHRRGRTWRR